MRHRSIGHLTAILALAALSAACNATPSVAVPVPAASTASTAAPTTVAPTTAAPKTTAPKPVTPACLGAVVHAIKANSTGPPWRPVCITVGGVIRLENLGPEYLSVNPWSKVSCFYAAGVHVCRMVYTGTVTFTVTNPSGVRLLTVNVVGAISPPRPSSACTSPGTFILDATEGGMPWSAVCVKLGTIVRVVHLGPDGFAVSPASAVSCWYEAGVRECRFIKAATVTFTISVPDYEVQELIVVAIK